MGLTPAERAELERVVSGAISAELDRRRSIDEATHAADHEYLRTLRERAERWDRRWSRVLESVLGSLAISALAALGYAVLEFARWVLRRNGE